MMGDRRIMLISGIVINRVLYISVCVSATMEQRVGEPTTAVHQVCDRYQSHLISRMAMKKFVYEYGDFCICQYVEEHQLATRDCHNDFIADYRIADYQLLYDIRLKIADTLRASLTMRFSNVERIVASCSHRFFLCNVREIRVQFTRRVGSAVKVSRVGSAV